MKNIKFRAWDKITKQIFEVEKIDFNAIERNVYGFITYKSILGGVDKRLSFRSFDNVELMQFTGLYDKHGKEIYEGDIVRLVGDLKMLYENFDYYNIISEVIFNNDTISFDALRIAPALNKNNCIFFEVIGNIHQHSEILENLKQPRVFTEMPNF